MQGQMAGSAILRKQMQGVPGRVGQESPGVAAVLPRGDKHLGCYHRQGWPLLAGQEEMPRCPQGGGDHSE